MNTVVVAGGKTASQSSVEKFETKLAAIKGRKKSAVETGPDSEILSRHSTQGTLMKLCKGQKEHRDLMIYLCAKGVPMSKISPELRAKDIETTRCLYITEGERMPRTVAPASLDPRYGPFKAPDFATI